MKLGGFVLFRNNVTTLAACLASLQSICDEVVALDSGATDGSAELARATGVRVLTRAWRGYGDARAAAVAALEGCSHVFYLDSDEYLLPEAVQSLRAWKALRDPAPVARVRLREWYDDGQVRFVFRYGTRARLMARELARWRPEMIVHETLRLPRAWPLDVTVEHRFITSLDTRARKNDRYAWLWALQAFVEGRRSSRSPPLAHVAEAARELLWRGALGRGGLTAVRAAWQVARYHGARYAYLRRFRAGEWEEAVRDFREGRLASLYS